MPAIHQVRHGAVAHVVIDNTASRNGLTPQMGLDIADAVRTLGDDPSVRAIVLRGEGGHFCSGADLAATAALLSESDDRIEAHIRDDMHGAVQALVRCPTPTLAQVQGACVGIGLSLAMACDLRIAATDAKLGLVFTRIGLHPDGGSSYLLPRLVGMGRALELMLLAETFDGERAHALGLVNRAVPPGEVEGAVAGWAERLAAGPPIAYRLLKGNLHFGASGASLDEVLDREARTQVGCIRSEDAIRGVQGFFSKEKPRFEGR